MPVPYQIIPEHVYPHQATYINDNTEVSKTYSTSSSDVTALLCLRLAMALKALLMSMALAPSLCMVSLF